MVLLNKLTKKNARNTKNKISPKRVMDWYAA